MQKLKKPIIIIAAGLIAIVFVFLFLGPKNTPNPFILPLKVPNIIGGGYSVQLNVQEDNFKFPSELPLIKIDSQSALTEDEAQEVASNLNFTGQPRIVNDVFDGTTYIWNSPDGPLTAYSKPRKIEYIKSLIGSVVNKQLSDESIIQIAKDFLIANFGFSPDDLEFTFFSFTQYEEDDGHGHRTEDKNSASVYQANFSPKIAESKLLTLDSAASPIYVAIDPSGVVRKASVVKFKDIEKSDTNFTLKNYEQVKASLNGAIIVSIDNGNVDLSDIASKELSEITVNSVDLAYILDSSDSTFLQPVYILKGTTKIVGYEAGVKVNVLLYLPALAN